MELNWHYNIKKQTLKCKINDDLSYQALNGGKGGFIKTYQNTEHTISYEDWITEKEWISDYFHADVGELVEPDDQVKSAYMKKLSEFVDNPVEHSFGISEDGWAYDRMQRKTKILQNADSCLMAEIGRVKDVGIFETPDGVNIYKRKWCEYQNDFYNTMPCCIFPDNPGWIKSSLEELESHGLDINNETTQSQLQFCEPDLLNKHFDLP